MRLSSIYKRVVLLSPYIEVAVRCFYWNNVKWFQKYKNASAVLVDRKEYITADFNKVVTFLKEHGVKEGEIMIVHSSYGNLKGTRLAPEEIIDTLFSIVGEKGTLAMPAIREFPEEEGQPYFLEKYINNELVGITTVYDIYKSTLVSGLLPFTLMRYDEAAISEFPLNPMTAIGAEAEAMMEHNLEGEYPSAHGENSSWKYCADRNAWNIGIGVSIKDYLTIMHVTQENLNYPVKDWCFHRDFIIKKGKREKLITIRERKHKWTKYMAETNFYNDLIKNGILKTAVIDGIPVYMTQTKVMFEFINKQKNPSYPYYLAKKYRK